jgi:hypothetical protein
MRTVRATYNPGHNPFLPQPVARFDADGRLGDVGLVYEFNVKIHGLPSNADQDNWDWEVETALRAFKISFEHRHPWADVEGFTGRSGGWLAIKDTTGRMTPRTLEITQQRVKEALEAFKKHMVARYPR